MIKNLNFFFLLLSGTASSRAGMISLLSSGPALIQPSGLDRGTRASQGQVLLGRKESSAVLQNSSFSSPEHEILLLIFTLDIDYLPVNTRLRS